MQSGRRHSAKTSATAERREVAISPRGLAGTLRLPTHAKGLVVFAHGSGSSRQSPRNNAGDHRSLALWASDCAEHVLPYFEEKYPIDDRPRKAVEAGRAWARGEIKVGAARAAAIAAHAAARDAEQGAARAVARAAGHAAATAHMAGHAGHAATYAVTAAASAADPIDAAAATAKERGWQHRHLPKHLRSVAFPARRND